MRTRMESNVAYQTKWGELLSEIAYVVGHVESSELAIRRLSEIVLASMNFKGVFVITEPPLLKKYGDGFRQPFLCEDLEDLDNNLLRRLLERNGINTFISHPIIIGKVLAGIVAFTKDGAGQWTNEDKRLLQIFSITVLQCLNKPLHHHDHIYKYDKMTGLYNRGYFEHEISTFDQNQHYPLAVIMGDLNGLKMTNDTYGHEEGDMLLKEIGNIINGVIDTNDNAARWGGDEFLILLPNASQEEAQNVCDEIKRKCSYSKRLLSEHSISFGYAIKTDSSGSINASLRQAERLMYKKKTVESKNFRNTTIKDMQRSLRESSHETARHTHQLATIGKKICLAIGLSQRELYDYEMLASLHDIGKISISKKLLLKPTPLTKVEWQKIKSHVESGYRILKSVPELSHIAELVLNHHEKWDGTGYPSGKYGGDIPLLSRILAVVDAYDAMTNTRAYREAFSHEEAIKEITACKGQQFDPFIVEVFLKIINEEKALSD